MVGSEGLSQPSSGLFTGAFSIKLDVVSDDAAWSSDAVRIDLPSPVLLPGASSMVFPEGRSLVVYAKDSDTYEVLLNLPYQQLLEEGEEVRLTRTLQEIEEER